MLYFYFNNFPMVIPQSLVNKVEGQKSEGRWGKVQKRGGCVMAVVTKIALQHM